MIRYRPFLNTDIPALLEIWQQQPPMRCLSPVLTRDNLDHLILAKPWFDARGLILAFRGEQPVGFVHAGFGPREDRKCIDYSVGIVSQLRVVDSESTTAVSTGLLDQAVNYLTEKGSRAVYAGGHFPDSPFYLGLYGGSRIPGVPEEDVAAATAFKAFGFEKGTTIRVVQRHLASYRPPVGRAQLAIGRSYSVNPIEDPGFDSWWDCCAFGPIERIAFEIVKRTTSEVAGQVMFWDMQPLSLRWGQSTAGLIGLRVEQKSREQGLAGFLLGEAFRHLCQFGYAMVEMQYAESNEPAASVARRMGFEPVSCGHQMDLRL